MCLSTVFCNLKSYELKYWECEQFNHSRVFLKVSAIGVIKHLSKSSVFGIDTGLLITFLGIPDPKIKCFIEKWTFLPSGFLFISKKYLHSGNTEKKVVFV